MATMYVTINARVISADTQRYRCWNCQAILRQSSHMQSMHGWLFLQKNTTHGWQNRVS